MKLRQQVQSRFLAKLWRSKYQIWLFPSFWLLLLFAVVKLAISLRACSLSLHVVYILPPEFTNQFSLSIISRLLPLSLLWVSTIFDFCLQSPQCISYSQFRVYGNEWILDHHQAPLSFWFAIQFWRFDLQES